MKTSIVNGGTNSSCNRHKALKHEQTSDEPEKFWHAVSLERCADKLKFSNVSRLMMSLKLLLMDVRTTNSIR